MNKLLHVCLLLTSSAALANPCIVAPIDPKAPDRAFDFLVGQHDVTLHAWWNETWSAPRPTPAEWHGWRGLAGQAIYDEWHDPDPAQGGSGVNVRIYDAETAEWTMMWISTRGKVVQELKAGLVDGVLRMWQIHPKRPGWHAEFHVLDEQRWARTEYMESNGKPEPKFRLVAHRTGCAEKTKILSDTTDG